MIRLEVIANYIDKNTGEEVHAGAHIEHEDARAKELIEAGVATRAKATKKEPKE